MTQTRIDITARDLTARAFGSVDGRLAGLSGGVRKLTGLFGALGLGISAVGTAQSLKGIIDAQDQLAKLSQSTGIAVESLAGLEFAANQSGTTIEQVSKGVRRFSRVILESVDGTDKYGKLIRALGLELNELKSATPEEQFIRLAGAIRDNVSEQERAVVITSLFGNEYASLVPLLAQGEDGLRDLIAEGQRYNPVTTEMAANAEIFNDNLDRLGKTLNHVFVELSSNLVPALNSVSESMLLASRNGGILDIALAGVVSSIREFSKAHLGVEFFPNFQADIKAADELDKSIESATESTQSLEKQSERAAKTGKTFSEVLASIDKRSDAAGSSTKRLAKGLSDQERQAKSDAAEIERLTDRFDPLIARNRELARLVELRNRGLSESVFDAAAAESINRYIKSLGEVAEEITDIDDRTRQINVTTQQVLDSNEQIWISGVRGVQNALADGIFNFFDDGLKGMLRSVKFAVGRITSEFLSVRALQATGLFGLRAGSGAAGGGASVGITDILSTASSLKTLSSFGANTSLFNTISAGANAVGFTGAGGTAALGAFSNVGGAGTAFIGGPGTAIGGAGLSGAGTGAASLSGLVSAAAPVLAGASLGVFGGSLIAGNKELAGLNGLATSGIGAAGGAAIGTAIVPGIGTAIGAFIGGVLGGATNALFGRADPKFSREELVGTITAEGFTGALNSSFKEKGGAFRSSRFSNFIADTGTGELLNSFGRLNESGNFPKGLAELVGPRASARAIEVGDFLDEAFKGVADTLRETGDVIGISTDGLKDFSFELDIISDKAKTLSEEQIAEVISDVSNEMVESFIPNIKELQRNQESNVETLSRLSTEFTTLQRALLVAGDSADVARSKLQGLDFEGRTQLVDEIGGIQVFNAELSSFVDNVLNESQKIDLVEQQILSVLEQFNVGFIPTTEQLFEAFKSGNPEFVKAAFAVDELVAGLESMKETAEGLGETTKEVSKEVSNFTNDDFKDMMSVIADERRSFTAARREAQAGGLAPTIATTIGNKIFTEADIRAQQQQNVDSAVGRLRELAQEQLDRTLSATGLLRDQISSIREAGDFFAQFKEDALELAGMNFTAARQQVQAATELSRAGAAIELIDTPELAKAIETLKEDRSAFFSSRFEFEKERARTINEIEELSLSGKDNAQEQIDILTEQLNVMEQTLAAQEGLLREVSETQGAATPAGSLTDAELQAQLGPAQRRAFEALRVQGGTTFNGSVNFPSPFGSNESADNAALRQFGGLLRPESVQTENAVISGLRKELSELRETMNSTLDSQNRLFNFFSGLTPDGRSLRTTT